MNTMVIVRSAIGQFVLCFLVILVIATSSRFFESSWFPNPNSTFHFLKGNQSQDFQPIQIYNDSATKLPLPCIIILPIADIGIGDQLYRYSIGYKLARFYNTTLFIGIEQDDLTHERNFTAKARQFALGNFKLDSSITKYIPTTIIKKIPSSLTLTFAEAGYMNWKKHLTNFTKILLLTEYWQSYYFFDEFEAELKQQFVLRHPNYTATTTDLVQDIELSESVSVHVRRGDFLGDGPRDRDLPISYQFRAIKLMTHLLRRRTDKEAKAMSIKFFIFSDDISWVENTFQNSTEVSDIVQITGAGAGAQFIYVSALNLSSLDEFELMRQCKHNIIQNSGYSWWAAYLNRNSEKIVIAPFPRHRQKLYVPYGNAGSFVRQQKEWMDWNHAYPPSWITMNPYLSFQDSL